MQVLPAPDRVTIITVPKCNQSVCPLCGVVSGRIHSHYNRTLADLLWQGRSVAVQVRARRFRCTRIGCPRRIFTERFPDVAPLWARRTVRLGDVQRHLGFALGGEPGSRLVVRLSMPLNDDTLLRLIGTAALEPHSPPRVAGIDDWSWRRGQRYGTIICDLERSRVIDSLPERSAEAVAAWLQQHPGVAVIARDRAGAYAEGARQGAPDAIQVADRWHLLRNLGEAVQAAVGHDRAAVGQAARLVANEQSAAQVETTPALPSTKATRRRAERQAERRTRYEALHRLHVSGLSAEAIAPALGMSATVVRRWLRAEGPPAHSKPRQPRPLDAHHAVLDRCWREGCRNATRLWRALRDQGFAGSRGPVARWVARQRRADPPALAGEVRRAAAWPAPSSRRCARMLTVAPDELAAPESLFLANPAKTAPRLTQAGELAANFAALVRKPPDAMNAPMLEAWLARAKGTVLNAFVRGIERDHDAVLAALVKPWSTGPVEGQINRLKLLKRTMYGRAKYHLLRRRVLGAA